MKQIILKDGIALWILLACGVTALAGTFCIGALHLKALKENYTLKLKNTYLKEELSRVKDRLYKISYKIPEVDNNGNLF